MSLKFHQCQLVLIFCVYICLSLSLSSCRLNQSIESVIGGGASAPSTPGTNFPDTVLPANPLDWKNLIQSESLTLEQIEELFERVDETPASALWELVFKRDKLTSQQAHTLSLQLNKIVKGSLTNQDVDVEKARDMLWGLVTVTLDIDRPLCTIDISEVDFSVHDISFFDFSSCENVPWNSINNNNHASGFKGINFSGLDLSGFNPSATISLGSINLSGATNIPWGAISLNTHADGLSQANLSGLNLSGLNFTNITKVNGLNIFGAIFTGYHLMRKLTLLV